jgi:hypothetical protein
MLVEDSPLAATWSKYIVISYHVARLGMKDKRFLFSVLRNSTDVDENVFIPQLGITTGEFAVFHTLAQSRARASVPSSA